MTTSAADGGVPWWTLRRAIGRAPATSLLLLTLLVTTATLAGSGAHVVRWLVKGASTNLHNMTWHPVYVLLVSPFWVQSVRWIVPVALLTVAVMGPAERVLGTRTTLLIFAAGHVGATLVTVGAIDVGVSRGWLPHSLAFAADVGPSYGLAALAGVLTFRLRPGLVRRIGLTMLMVALGVAAVVGADFTDAGHLAAAVLGLVIASRLTGVQRHATTQGSVNLVSSSPRR